MKRSRFYGFIESFNGRLRDEVLNETLFSSIVHARAILAEWRADYNAKRPHSRLEWMTPLAYAATLVPATGRAAAQRGSSRLAPLHIPPKWAQLRKGFYPSPDERWGARHSVLPLRGVSTLTCQCLFECPKRPTWNPKILSTLRSIRSGPSYAPTCAARSHKEINVSN
jgi:hypothetical protein